MKVGVLDEKPINNINNIPENGSGGSALKDLISTSV